MARIRSVHPGQWTDEAFVSCSFGARLLAIGLRNEADDYGVFAWNPVVIKMRLFPADAVLIDDLLEELARTGQIQRYEVDGKAYGAIRNFLRFQSPKYPKSAFPLPDEIVAYVVGSPSGPEMKPVNSGNRPTSTPKGGGKSPQRERRGEEKSTSPSGDASPPVGGDPPAPDRRSPPAMPLEAAAQVWNEVCGPSLGRVAKLTDLRRKHLRARLVEHWPDDPLGGWGGYCRRIQASDFLTGRRGGSGTHVGWKADFDWACNSANAVKVLEGRYDNDRDRAPPRPGLMRVAEGTV